MNSFRLGRIELGVLIALSLLLLGAGVHILRSNNRPSPQETLSRLSLTDSTHTSMQRSYAPPKQRATASHSGQLESAIELSKDYVGAPTRPTYKSVPKLSEGQQIDLNSADTLALQQVPGIGSSFARRIVKYRDELGGYYTVLQLQEVYGMEPARFRQIKPYLYIGLRPYVSDFAALRSDSIPTHPYLNYRQRSALARSIKKSGTLDSWARIMTLEEFNRDDSVRLSHYFHFPRP